MAPSWVLLKRTIYFEQDVSETGGETSLIGGASGIARGVPSRQDIRDAILAHLRTLKPDAHFANSPELSSLRLLRPTKSVPRLCGGIYSAVIASADKNLIALYAGHYRPGNDLKGGYLIYDASKNSLSTIPHPPYDYYRADLGIAGAVVVCLEEGNYLLAELTRIRDDDRREAALCTWRSSSAEWVVEVASFPPELCPPNYFFEADMCFSCRGSILCWVDLLKGMVACDSTLRIGGRPEFRFIPLPLVPRVYDLRPRRRKV